MRPTLLNSCAAAATTAEARYRIDAAPQAPRSTRVVALDDDALTLVTELAAQPWLAAQFLSYDGGAPGDGLADVLLHSVAGDAVRLSETLAETDFVMMIATADAGAAAASAIGTACTLRGITTAGLVVGTDGRASGAVAALRPHARVLLVTDDENDATELLAAVGA
jgi:hypothetical protein